MCSVPSRRTATLSPYQTFQRQPGWLQAEWLILEQHVLHSSNHLCQPQAMQSTTSTTRQSSARTRKEFSRISITWIRLFSKDHPLSLPPCHSRHPPQPHDVVQCFPATIMPRGIRRRGSWRSHKNTLGRTMPVWENTSPWFSSPRLSSPLSKQPTLSNKHMDYQWHMKERAQIQVSGTFLSEPSWISTLGGSGPKWDDLRTSCHERELAFCGILAWVLPTMSIMFRGIKDHIGAKSFN